MDKILNLGSVVRVREDLVVGEQYWNYEYTDYEIFTEDMAWARGKEFMILAFDESGYILDWTECVFTYEMLE
jgi:hypothetical protein